MSEWRPGRLGDVVEIIMGQSPLGESCNHQGIGMPLLNGPTEFGQKYPVPVQYTNDPKRVAKPGDILFCVRGSTTGRMNLADQNYAIGRGIAAICHKNGDAFQNYVKGLIYSNLDQLLLQATGSTFPNVSREQLNALSLSIPPLPEQKAIAEILSSLDDKIDLLHRNNKTLEAMAETIFRQWFMEEAKEEWETVSLYDVLDIMSGGTPSTKCSEFWDGDIPWFTPKDITDSPYCICTQKQITELGLAKCNSMLFEPETVFITARGTVGKVAICAVNMAINQSCYALKSRNGLRASFVYLLMKNAVKSIQQNASGAVFDAIVVDTFKAIEYILPTADSEVYDRFEEICDPLFEKIKINTIHIQSLESLRDTLLPKLISGEVKVDMGGKIIDY